MIKKIVVTIQTTEEDNARYPEGQFKTEIEARGDIVTVLDLLFYNGFEFLDGMNVGNCLPLLYRALHTLTSRDSQPEIKAMLNDDPEGLIRTTRGTLEDILVAALRRPELALEITYLEAPDEEGTPNLDGRCPYCDTEYPGIEDQFVDGKESVNLICVNPKCKKAIHFSTATVIVAEPHPAHL